MRRLAFVLLALAAACATAPAPRTTPVQKPLLGEHGFVLSGMDPTANACEDFYQYAVGAWRKANPLPAAFSRFGRFEEVAERNRGILRTILEESAANNAQKIGAFWNACMNEQAIDAQGIAPIAPDLARIDAITDRAGVVAEIRRMQQRNANPLFRFGAQNDRKNSDMMIAAVSQGGLGLPDRDYYLRDDANFRDTRQKYVDHVARMFELAGSDPQRARADAERVLSLETELARASMTRVEQRNPEKVYNVRTVAELQTTNPAFEWPALFSAVGIGDLQSLNVAQPGFFSETNRLLSEVPVETWKAFLRWNTLDTAAPALSSAFVNEDFAFRGRVLSGQQELKPRWQRCVQVADQSIGGLLGQEYVKRAFTPEAKRKMSDLIDNLIAALREDIPRLTWMGPATQSQALAKLDAFKRRIGYPDVWQDYSTLQVSSASFAQNLIASRQWALRRTVNRIGKPDDPNEWGFFTPATVNASYNPARNFITFPAGILQPPFYDPNADDAYNYGGIGTVIGHEMTHGFDDSGSKFDASGNLRNWWTPEDLKNFQARAECIANQYSEFAVEPNLNIQGKLVTGEAIADLGGATLALRAYEKALEGKERKLIDGFTPEQRFFLGFAQVWGENMAPEEQRRRALTDPHAQGPFRVNGTVANMPEFHRAFRCAEDTQMVRVAEKRCNIW